MTDNPKWQRERGYRNYMNQRMYLPHIDSRGIATMVDGQRYRVQDNGWRKITKER